MTRADAEEATKAIRPLQSPLAWDLVHLEGTALEFNALSSPPSLYPSF